MDENGIDTDRLPPVMVMVLITGLSQILVMEDALGMTAGHAETREVVDRCIRQLEGPGAEGRHKAEGDRSAISSDRRTAKVLRR